jgi:cbb3-type cytochrome oxidase maturation protein
MDVLFVLVPLSVVLVLGVLVALFWTLHAGQFDNLEHEGERILFEPEPDGSTPRAAPLIQASQNGSKETSA